MKDTELLADLFSDFAKTMHRHVDPLDDEALAWRPDAQGNSIGLTVWHVSRWMDLLTVVVLQNRSHDDEQWHTRGWRAKTGYDPRGIGFNGFGAITGYTADEANAVPAMPHDDLLVYFDQTGTALREQLLAMSDEALQQPAPGSHQGVIAYNWVKAVLLGFLGHAGEIEAYVAMRARR
jgi:hypothetical protein